MIPKEAMSNARAISYALHREMLNMPPSLLIML
jgi:hypothetical protein